MIIVKTRMRKIPDKCKNCKYSFVEHEPYDSLGTRICLLERKELEYQFVKESKNWCYIKPDWCPLVEIQDDKINVL